MADQVDGFISESAAMLVGEHVKVDGKPGQVIDVMQSGSTITTAEGETFPGIRFQLRYDDGTTGWTVTFADKDDWYG